MTAWQIQIGVYAAQLLFLAGGFYFFIKQIRKDLNGVGTKVRSVDERADDRYLAVVVVALLLTPPDKQAFVAGVLLGAGKGKIR